MQFHVTRHGVSELLRAEMQAAANREDELFCAVLFLQGTKSTADQWTIKAPNNEALTVAA